MADPEPVTESTDGLTGRGLRIGDGPGETPEVVAVFRLGEARRALRNELRRLGVDLDTALADQTLDPEDVNDVVSQATMRVLRNPEGLTKQSGSIDDYSESRERSDASQDVYFTAAELRRLTPVTAYDLPAAGSIKYS